MQQGFIKGRSMVENTLKVDLAAKRTLKNRTTDIPSCGAIVLFDFRAAFPSVDQAFLVKAPKQFGFGDNWLKYIEKKSTSGITKRSAIQRTPRGSWLTRASGKAAPLANTLRHCCRPSFAHAKSSKNFRSPPSGPSQMTPP
jgi:hypothetical protein